jgi:lipopolysaccharide transport system permease protein
MLGMLNGVWLYRNFIISSIRSDFRARFTRSRLGGLWMIIHPLAQVAMFAFVLSTVLSAKLPGIDSRYTYSIYLMSGMMAWSLFVDVVTRCQNIFIDSGSLLKKLVFPRICLPVIVTGISLISNLLLFAAIVVIFALLGHIPGASIIWMPLLLLITLAFSIGLGLIVGVLNVFLRDIGQIMPVALQFWFWFTPVVYLPNHIPENYRPWMMANPVYHIVTGYQQVLLFNKPPALFPLLLVGIGSLALLAFALFLFRKASPEMVDVL